MGQRKVTPVDTTDLSRKVSEQIAGRSLARAAKVELTPAGLIITLHVPDKLRANLENLAKATGIKVNEVIRTHLVGALPNWGEIEQLNTLSFAAILLDRLLRPCGEDFVPHGLWFEPLTEDQFDELVEAWTNPMIPYLCDANDLVRGGQLFSKAVENAKRLNVAETIRYVDQAVVAWKLGR